MNFSLVVSSAAFKDISKAKRWYRSHHVSLSSDFQLRLREGFKDILNNPLGVVIKYKNIRVKYMRRFPYGIHYVLEEDVLVVLAVFHTSRDPQKWVKNRNDPA